MVRMRLFRKLFALRIPIAILVLYVQCFAATFAQAEQLTVQAGTPVDLNFETTVSSESATQGQEVIMRVATPVVVNGKTVVEVGASAVGEVVFSKKSGMVGMAGRISVAAKRVTAVDGTVIALTGSKDFEGKDNMVTSIVITVVCCILGLLMKGGKAEIPSGSSLRASVATPVQVNVN
jgi:hypothetical protein